MRYYIRIGIMLLQTSLDNTSNVSPILCHISRNLQDALLAKLLSQFIEEQKSQFFQKLENLI